MGRLAVVKIDVDVSTTRRDAKNVLEALAREHLIRPPAVTTK